MLKREQARTRAGGLSLVVGLTAVIFSALYLVSDVVEVIQGGFSTVQLVLTFAAEATIPFFVIGLYLVQRPRIGALGFGGAAVYAYTFVFFTGTVWFALVDGTSDWNELVGRLGIWMTIHGALMVFSGFAFGLAVVRAGVLPRWTGAALMVGVVLIASSSGLSGSAQMASAGVRDVAFGGMGLSLLIARRGLRRRGSTIALSPTSAQPAWRGSYPALQTGADVDRRKEW
jgi:hypothetical protein